MADLSPYRFCPVPRLTLIGASRGLGHPGQAFYRLGALIAAREKGGLDTVARDLPGVAVLGRDASAADKVCFP